MLNFHLAPSKLTPCIQGLNQRINKLDVICCTLFIKKSKWKKTESICQAEVSLTHTGEAFDAAVPNRGEGRDVAVALVDPQPCREYLRDGDAFCLPK